MSLRAEKGGFIIIMRLIGMLGPRTSADSQPVVFSVSSRLGDTLAEALVHQNKNDSSGGSPLSLLRASQNRCGILMKLREESKGRLYVT